MTGGYRAGERPFYAGFADAYVSAGDMRPESPVQDRNFFAIADR